MAAPQKPAPTSKKSKLYNSRTIRSETVDPSYKNGGLNIPDFLAAREYEIKAFEQSQLNTKAASATRVFQSLPRTLRRRTASHNVKRVPKRLRAKAVREMQNNANGTPEKKPHLRGRQLHRLKMQKRLLRLASKIKDSRGVPYTSGTSIKEKILSLNKQLSELKKESTTTLNNAVAAMDRCSVNSLTAKPSGNLKYGHRQKKFTWMPTHVWHAKRFHMTKRWGFQVPFSPNQKCFRLTSRAVKQSTLAFESSYYSELIVECLHTEGVSRFLRDFSRYCDTIPHWFLHGEKVYNGWIYLSEQKFVPGVIIVDSLGHNVLVRLHPNVYEEFFAAVLKWTNGEFSVVDTRYAVGSVELRGPTALNSLSKILHVDAKDDIVDVWRACSQTRDPRLIPSGTKFSFFVKDPRFWKHPVNPPPSKLKLNKVLLANHSAVDPKAVKALFSLEARKESYKDMHSIKQLGQEFSRRDPLSTHIHAANKFPIVIFKTSEESWCVSMPWFWVQPLWSKLIKVSGVKPAGMRQIHQLNFEYSIPTYPQDFPYLPEGYKEHLMASKAAKLAREKLPLSKQKPSKINEGELSTDADWYFLWKWKFGMSFVQEKDGKPNAFGDFGELKTRSLRTPEDLAIVINATRDTEMERVPITAFSKNNSDHEKYVNGTFVPDRSGFMPMPVVQVNLALSEKGSINDNARIYERVANPTIKNLIGFVTSGAFNFNVGYPTAIGLISADSKALSDVLIRNVGCTTFAKAKISLV